MYFSGPEHIDLIFEYGGWVLKSHPEDGLKIFIGDKTTTSGEVEQLPRPKVLNFLKKTEKSLVVPYLVSTRDTFFRKIKKKIYGGAGYVLQSRHTLSLPLIFLVISHSGGHCMPCILI